MKGRNLFSDAEIIAAISSNESLNDAIRSLYDQYAETIIAYVVNNSGSQQDAEDIFQESIVSFIESVRNNKFRGEAAIKTFLIAIARHCWLNELKKRDRSMKREEIYEHNREWEEADISERIGDREVKQQFRNLLKKMDESCRKILTLFYYENLSMKEIVQHLPYENEQVVRNKKYKCLKNLTELFKDNPMIARFIK